MALISMLLVSKRPRFLPAILTMLAAQTYPEREIIVILHGYLAESLPETAQAALAIAARVESVPANLSLGRCLNHAIGLSRGELLAKIDDDDLYGPNYLAEAMAAFIAGHGEVLGKREFYIHLVDRRIMLLINPGHSLAIRTMLVGPSLVFHRKWALSPGFRDVSLSEDRLFVRDCAEAGARCWATSRRNLIVRRYSAGHDHTWLADDSHLMSLGVVIRTGLIEDDPAVLLSAVSD